MFSSTARKVIVRLFCSGSGYILNFPHSLAWATAICGWFSFQYLLRPPPPIYHIWYRYCFYLLSTGRLRLIARGLKGVPVYMKIFVSWVGLSDWFERGSGPGWRWGMGESSGQQREPLTRSHHRHLLRGMTALGAKSRNSSQRIGTRYFFLKGWTGGCDPTCLLIVRFLKS